MKFHFELNKSIAATAFVLQENGGSAEILFVVKVLYDANRQSLLEFGRSITGDHFSSMEHGPVVCQTYDLLKGNKDMGTPFRNEWGRFITPRDGNIVGIVPNSNPEIGYLSRREVQLLEHSFARVKAITGRIDVWAHKAFPEWEKVKPGTSKPLPAERIFEEEHRPKEEIEALTKEIDELTSLRNFLHT
jgi:hypothetical protein